MCEEKSRREDAEGVTVRETKKVTRGKVAPEVLVLSHLDPLGHVLEDGVHSLQGVFPLRRRGAIVVAFHVDALMVYGCQVGPATPGGSRGE